MRSSSSLRSLHRESRNQNDSHNRISALSPSPAKAPAMSGSPSGGWSDSEERRSSSPYESSLRQPRGRMTRDVSSSPPRKLREQKLCHNSTEISQETKEKRGIPEAPDRQRSSKVNKDPLPDDGPHALYSGEVRKSDDKGRSHTKNVKESSQQHKLESVQTSVQKVDNTRSSGFGSGSEEIDNHKTGGKEKRKHKRSERQETGSDDDYSSDSDKEGRKEAKRRRKEEKRLRKEKKRQKREDRRRRREERRAEKLRGKNHSDASASDGEYSKRRDSHTSENEGTESEQKKLEIELRKKALESLKAKKGIGH
ncbi:hypothetical protein TorRG33x02_261160 [Trema orientale]|uniref:Uncharacterized protein n=1 Tax=Trema orientale TaxID=63057 RepID=A0A2P5D6C8_TREOI|nr:hypothetical protein TorRG33x02_261160 [Trema orientale]